MFKNSADADVNTELDLLRKEVQELRSDNQQQKRENQELRDQLALIQPPEGIVETQPTSAQLTGKSLLIYVYMSHDIANGHTGGCEYTCLYLPAGFRGVEVRGETTVVVTKDPQNFTWEGYGLKLHIPQGCLPAGVEQCTINIKASLAGQYEFPENTHLISAVFWFHCEVKFTKKITLEINHCAESGDCTKLTFVRAVRSQGQLPYTFSPLGGDFTGHSSYGAIELKTFCGIGAVNQGSADRRYCGNLLYKEIKAAAAHYVVEIYFIVLWDTEAHSSVCNSV